MVFRPDEMRNITYQAITAASVEMPFRNRKKGQAQKFNLIERSAELRAVVMEALSLQRTISMYVFGNNDGQAYTTSGWNTNLRRLMVHAEKKSKGEQIEFARFTLKNMRPAAVTNRVDDGDKDITNATSHRSDHMVRQIYDRRKTKTATATK